MFPIYPFFKKNHVPYIQEYYYVWGPSFFLKKKEYYHVFPGVSFSFILRIFRQSCPRLDVSRMDSRTFLSFLNHFL